MQVEIVRSISRTGRQIEIGFFTQFVEQRDQLHRLAFSTSTSGASHQREHYSSKKSVVATCPQLAQNCDDAINLAIEGFCSIASVALSDIGRVVPRPLFVLYTILPH